MGLLLAVLWPIEKTNDVVLAIARVIAVAALAIMVCFILGQVFFRYVLNDAPNWTEEAARFGMLWMTGLMAPVAYRAGGFVAIDMLERAVPGLLSRLLTLFLLSVAMVVLYWGVKLGWDNVNSLTARGRSASLRVPLEMFGGTNIKFRNAYAFWSLLVGFGLLSLVNIELMLRNVIAILGGGDRLTPLNDVELAGAE